jgi:small-conductance mechanosensitive channel
LIAGVQIALTEPMRIDDVVIVEGEWGRLEEVNTTYVVIRTWDLRRLIVPLTYFMEKPFQNWTRTSTDLIGTVFIHADYTVPVEDLRAELQRLVEASTLWNRKTCVLHVTDAKERTMELRALVSASNASDLWDLRCYTREGLVRFLQERHPRHLPRMRAEVWSRTDRDGDRDGDSESVGTSQQLRASRNP